MLAERFHIFSKRLASVVFHIAQVRAAGGLFTITALMLGLQIIKLLFAYFAERFFLLP